MKNSSCALFLALRKTGGGLKPRYKFNAAFTMVELIAVILIVGILSLIALPKLQEDRLPELAEQMAADIRYTQMLNMQNNPLGIQDIDPRFWFTRRWIFEYPKVCLGKIGYSIYKTHEFIAADPSKIVVAKDPVTGREMYHGDISTGNPLSGITSCDESRLNPRLTVLKFKKRDRNGYDIYDSRFLRTTFKNFYGGTLPMLCKTCDGGVTPGNMLMFDEYGRPLIGNMMLATWSYTRTYHTINSGYGIQSPGGCNIAMPKYCKTPLVGQTQMAIIKIHGETGYVDIEYRPLTDELRRIYENHQFGSNLDKWFDE